MIARERSSSEKTNSVTGEKILTIAEHDADIAKRDCTAIGFEHNLPEASFICSDIDLVPVAAEIHNACTEALPTLRGLRWMLHCA